MTAIDRDRLYERIANELGWRVEDVQSFSAQALRELVRPLNAKLAHDLDEWIRSQAYIVTPTSGRRRK